MNCLPVQNQTGFAQTNQEFKLQEPRVYNSHIGSKRSKLWLQNQHHLPQSFHIMSPLLIRGYASSTPRPSVRPLGNDSTPSRRAAAEHGGGRQRRGVELVEAERGADEAEQDPGADHDEDGGVGELVEPEEQALLADVEVHGLLAQAHLLPPLPPDLLLRRRRRRRGGGGLLLRHHHHLRRRGVQPDPAGLVPRLEAVLDAGGLGSGWRRGT
ncbi:hypothetical protein Zm00014a_038674 [Zea mays]|uniref:Uncharacterized protein n=1 Tax=Zea mays TaxID=4577 RepID=A0A3L6EQF7_MAIZE|nr:hypothetical protein Zm00014a_038674 [Zea mays]